MDEWIEKARLNISEGWNGIIISFFVLLFFYYSLIWTIIEPLKLPDNLLSVQKHCIFSNVLFIHIVSSLILSLITVFCLFLKLKKYLQKISLQEGGTNIKSCWTLSEGNTDLKELRDGYLGKVLKIVGTNHNAIDHIVSPIVYKAKRVEYVVRPENNFVFYLNVKVKPKASDELVNKWIAMVLTSASTSPTFGPGADEWAYPLKPHPMDGGWIRYSINIKEAVKKTHGNQGYQYHSLNILRLRGNADIASIIIY
jgi:hypothetical protein